MDRHNEASLDVRTILATIGALTLQVKTFQERHPSNSLQNLHLNLLHLQLELTNALTVQDRYTFVVVLLCLEQSLLLSEGHLRAYFIVSFYFEHSSVTV